MSDLGFVGPPPNVGRFTTMGVRRRQVHLKSNPISSERRMTRTAAANNAPLRGDESAGLLRPRGSGAERRLW